MPSIKNQKHVSKSSTFPINFDSSLTTNIGEFLPTGIFELTPHTHVHGSLKSGARLAPMVNPTFGKCSVYDYVVNFKLNDIYPFYNDMISQTPIVGNDGAPFVPAQVPVTYSNILYCLLLTYSEFSIYVKLTNGQLVPLNRHFIYYLNQNGLSYDDIANFLFYTIHDHMPTKTFDQVGKRFREWQTVPNVKTAFTTLVDAYGCPPSTDYNNSALPYSVDGYDSKSSVNIENADYSLFVSDIYVGNSAQYLTNEASFKAQSLKSLMDGDDWKTMTNVLYGYQFTGAMVAGFYVTMNLNYYGKRLRKVLNGLGYQPNITADCVSLLPLIGYYKFWFETCNPKRNITYNDTICSKYFTYLGRNSAEPYCIPYTDSLLSLANDGISFSAFLRSLVDINFATKHNFVTLCRDVSDSTPNPFGFSQSPEPSSLGELNPNEIRGAHAQHNHYQGLQPSAQYNAHGEDKGFVTADGTTLTSEGLNLLQRFTQYINSKRFVPQSVKDFMMSKFGVNIPNESYIVSVQNSELYFDDVFQTSTTSEGYLGEYAGRSQGSGNKDFDFKTDEASYLMIISVVIPRTQFVQGQNSLITRCQPLDFYNADFDGLTMQQIPDASVFSTPEVVDSSQYVQQTPEGVSMEQSATFGVLPIYETYKLSPCGVLTGDLNLRSSRNTYAGFTLDSLIYTGDATLVQEVPNDAVQGKPTYRYKYEYDSVNRLPANMFCSQAWRFVSPDNGRSNLQRIFVTANYTSNGFFGESKKMLDDTIVLHHIFNFTLNAYMLPSSHSYQTFDLCELESNAAQNVELN